MADHYEADDPDVADYVIALVRHLQSDQGYSLDVAQKQVRFLLAQFWDDLPQLGDFDCDTYH